MPTPRVPFRPARQRGAALITGLIFLAVLSIIVVAGLRSSILEERMAANARNRIVAMQAAEHALRDAEALLAGGTPLTFSPNCTNGLCSPAAPGTQPRWQQYQSGTFSWVIDGRATTVALTDSDGIDNNNQPRYFIEVVHKPPYTGSGLCPREVYRITARGRGADNSEVLLESLFRVQPTTCT